jgi:hypothetical protein
MWDKWAKRDGILDDPEQDDGLDEATRRKKKRAEKGLYTGGGSNRKFCGWSSAGLVKYNELIAYVMSHCKADWTPVVKHNSFTRQFSYWFCPSVLSGRDLYGASTATDHGLFGSVCG